MKSLLGIFIGDCSGSPYEGRIVNGNKIGQYTDDTEQSYGICLWLKSNDHSSENLIKTLKEVFTGEDRGYGAGQSAFLQGLPYRTDSYGNGSSMRVAPIGEYCKNVDDVIRLAKLQSNITHRHIDAINGAVTIALLAYLVNNSENPLDIRKIYPNALLPITGRKYNCSLKASESVPPAVEAFLNGTSFKDILKRALDYGGDTDTIAAMACGLAALKYGIPDDLLEKVINASYENQIMFNNIQNEFLGY